MTGSPHFARIKADVLAIVSAIPKGRVTTFKEIGAHLDVMPRHVAYILATLEDPLQQMIPWHRVLADGGTFGKTARARLQEDLLHAEGLYRAKEGGLSMFAAAFLAAADIPSGVARQRRMEARSSKKA